MSNPYDNIVCAIPIRNKGILIYLLAGMRKTFSADYTFYLRENKDTMEAEVWVRTNFEIKQGMLNVIRGKEAWRA